MTGPSFSLLHSSDLWGQFSALWRFKLFWRGVFCGSTARRWLVQSVAMLSLLLVGLPAQAVTYNFSPLSGNLPPGCSLDPLSTSSYTCAVVSLAIGDTITIGAIKPVTITFNGAFTTAAGNLINAGSAASDLALVITTAAGNLINAGSAASDLTLVIIGVFTLGDNTVLNANVIGTAAVNLGAGSILSGNLTAIGADGVVTLGVNSTVGGYIHTDAGAVNVANSSTVGGGIATEAGIVTLGTNIKVGGTISSVAGGVTFEAGGSTCGSVISTGTGIVTLAENVKVGGDIRSVAGAITVAAGSTVGGSIIATGAGGVMLTGGNVGGNISTTAGAIALTDSRVRGSVAASGAGAVTLTTSVANDTNLVIPPVCPSTKVIYRREMY